MCNSKFQTYEGVSLSAGNAMQVGLLSTRLADDNADGFEEDA